MERPRKTKSMFLKFLPKAATFQNPTPFSPGRDHKLKAHHANYKGFSGPINFSALPDEAREKPKKGSYDSLEEPSSPKVSCMGQIKSKYKNKKKLMKKIPQVDDDNKQIIKSKQMKKSSSSISKFFTKSSPKKARKSNVSSSSDHDDHDHDHRKVIPSLGNMRKFTSGRESLADFDWTAQIAPADHHHHDRDCYSDEERRRDDSDEEEEEREIIIPYSAPILVGGRGGVGRLGLEPRKEINLWKRRTMSPPPPLTLNLN